MKYTLPLLVLLAIAMVACHNDETGVKPDYSLTDHLTIRALAIDPTGNLWVGSDSGLYRRTSSGYTKADLSGHDSITSLYVESGNNTLWVGTRDGLLKLDLKSHDMATSEVSDTNLNSNQISCTFIDSDSRRWFGTSRGFSKNEGSDWQKEKFKKNLSGTISQLPFEKLGVNSIAAFEGDYFFATNGIRLYRTTGWSDNVDAFSGATQWESPYNGAVISDTMLVVFVDSRGRQWMGGTQGIQVHTGHDPKTNITSYTEELSGLRIYCVAESPTGVIWIGTENGISRFDDLGWTNPYPELNGIKILALAFTQDGKLFIGTEQGLLEPQS